ncbi:MAG: phage holin family protein [Clostridiales bacterium]|nr:phage holin family protein [Clostridiales bacterium]
MDEFIEGLKIFISALIASGVSLFGASFKYILVLILLMAADTVFGWIRSRKNGTWKVSAAKSGFIGKIIELIFIGVLYLLDWIFQTNLLKYMGVFYFGICETASIINNYCGINGNLPEGTEEIINKARLGFGNMVISRIKSVINSFFDSGNGKKND